MEFINIFWAIDVKWFNKFILDLENIILSKAINRRCLKYFFDNLFINGKE